MLRQPAIILIFSLSFVSATTGQGIDGGPGYQVVLLNNPAISGSEGNGVLRLSYINYYPGNNYNLNSAILSYDSYFSGLHGGASFWLSDDYLGGIINDVRGGFSYAYFLKAGKDLYINAGLSASVFHRGFNFSNAVLPDQIDPLGGVSFPTSEVLSGQGKTVFDVGAGFLLISGRMSAGISVSHLAEPELSSNTGSTDKIRRKYFAHFSTDLDLNGKKSLMLQPLLFLGEQDGYFSGGAGTAVESSHLAVNALFLADNGRNINIQTGFSFRFTLVSVYYNYQFNLISGNSMLPLSLLHEVGLAFNLKSTEKRNIIKTINFPKL